MFKVFLWLIFGSISFGIAYGAGIKPIIPGPNPPETGPFGAIGNLYTLALGVSGLLAFGSIVYGAIVYTLAAGNPGGQNEGKEWIKQALLGLLLLVGAYIILNTINPALVKPGLSPLADIGERPPAPAEGGTATCTVCSNSPSVQSVLNCLRSGGLDVSPATTYQGTHSQNSCHFGGRTCTDGSHAIDFGKNAAELRGLTLVDMKTRIEGCASAGNPVTCYYEDSASARLPGPVGANHIHCNVNNASCGCN